ncbi:MAG TPA: PEP-CTERM sorting domain-containing protein [Phycisphaerae bacterium]|nr:PEP-CTERM sorting domain-containing protein [Phycisphaerae bacterium]
MTRVALLWVVLLALVCGETALGVEYPVLVETLEVSSLGAWPVDSQALATGQPYLFEASGTWNHNVYYDPQGRCQTDAEFAHHNWPDPGVWLWYELSPNEGGTYERDLHDLIINGAAVHWLGSSDGVNWPAHTFNPDHVYRYEWLGEGAPVSFMIADHTPFGPDCYHDNLGSLTVRVYTVPEPATLCLLALGGVVALRRQKHRP